MNIERNYKLAKWLLPIQLKIEINENEGNTEKELKKRSF